MGRPWSRSTSVSSLPLSSGVSDPAPSSTAWFGRTVRPPTPSVAPRKKYRLRLVSRPAGGSVQRAPGDILIVQIATSLSG